MDDNDNDGIRVLKLLPPEIFPLDIFPFLNLKALSTFHLALLSDRGNPRCEQTLQVGKYGCDCWKSLCQAWQESLEILESDFARQQYSENMGDDDNDNVLRNRLIVVRGWVREAVHFLQPEILQQQHQHQDSPISHAQKIMSQLMIVVEAFRLAQKYAGNPVPGARGIQVQPNRLVEAPIWCGRIQVAMWKQRGRFHGFQQVLLGANVILLSPLWGQRRHFEAWESLSRSVRHPHRDDDGNTINQADPATMATITMIADPYNFTPVPPIGRLVGLRQSDRETLKSISSTLQDQDTVAILRPLHDCAPIEMRLVLAVSRSQARERSRVTAFPCCYYARGTGEDCYQDDLICCWQSVGDNQITSIDTGTPYWKQILKDRDRGLLQDDSVRQESTPSGAV
jgi:hypothetical protein